MPLITRLTILLFSIQTIFATDELIQELRFHGYSETEIGKMLEEHNTIVTQLEDAEKKEMKMMCEEDKLAKQDAERKKLENKCPYNTKNENGGQCFCGEKQISHHSRAIWCDDGQYCYFEANYIDGASCHDYKHCTRTNHLEVAKANDDLSDICLCTRWHLQCGVGEFCTELGNCATEDVNECETNMKLTSECMCGKTKCAAGDVCIDDENVLNQRATCMSFCDDENDTGCICSNPEELPKLKFCTENEKCIVKNDLRSCEDLGEEENYEWETGNGYEDWENVY